MWLTNFENPEHAGKTEGNKREMSKKFKWEELLNRVDEWEWAKFISTG
jgi:hypothetical protein